MSDDPDTRDKILGAARVAFRERGTSGARMQDIADAAGVNKALLHYYFRNKETLAAAVFQGELQGLVQPVIRTLGSDLSLEEKVRKVVELYLDGLVRMPGLPAYVVAELNYHPERIHDFVGSVVGTDPGATGDRVRAKLGAQLQEAADAGRMRPLAPEQFTVNLVSLCVFPFAARPLLEVLILRDGDFHAFLEERRRSLPEFFLRSLRP